MSKQRPPQETLQRVIRVARFNGWTVVVIAGLATLAALFPPTWLDLVIGGGVFAGGVIELRGLKHLRQSADADRAVTLLVRAQLLILALIWLYSLAQVTFNLRPTVNELTELFAQMGADPSALADFFGMDANTLARDFCYLLYGMVSLTSVFYQGGLALYYHRRRAAVHEALSSPPPLPPAG